MRLFEPAPTQLAGQTYIDHNERTDSMRSTIDLQAACDAAELIDGDADAFPVGASDAIRALADAHDSDSNGLDELARFLYADPDTFPGGADTCEFLDQVLGCAGRRPDAEAKGVER
jgi:hypothetical protein